jgi:hypothetical protein
MPQALNTNLGRLSLKTLTISLWALMNVQMLLSKWATISFQIGQGLKRFNFNTVPQKVLRKKVKSKQAVF